MLTYLRSVRPGIAERDTQTVRIHQQLLIVAHLSWFIGRVQTLLKTRCFTPPPDCEHEEERHKPTEKLIILTECEQSYLFQRLLSLFGWDSVGRQLISDLSRFALLFLRKHSSFLTPLYSNLINEQSLRRLVWVATIAGQIEYVHNAKIRLK